MNWFSYTGIDGSSDESLSIYAYIQIHLRNMRCHVCKKNYKHRQWKVVQYLLRQNPQKILFVSESHLFERADVETSQGPLDAEIQCGSEIVTSFMPEIWKR